MGKILEDIHMEFYNQFNSESYSLNGVQCNTSAPLDPLPGQAPQVSYPDSGLASHFKFSSVVQSNLASQTINDLPPLPSSSLKYDEPSDLHPTMSQRLTTPSEVQTQKHLKAKLMDNDQLTATPMDHSGPIANHGSETASAEHVDPVGN